MMVSESYKYKLGAAGIHLVTRRRDQFEEKEIKRKEQ